MYNHTERTYPTAKEGKVLFTRNAGLGIAPKENSPTYSTKLICFDNKNCICEGGHGRH